MASSHPIHSSQPPILPSVSLPNQTDVPYVPLSITSNRTGATCYSVLTHTYSGRTKGNSERVGQALTENQQIEKTQLAAQSTFSTSSNDPNLLNENRNFISLNGAQSRTDMQPSSSALIPQKPSVLVGSFIAAPEPIYLPVDLLLSPGNQNYQTHFNQVVTTISSIFQQLLKTHLQGILNSKCLGHFILTLQPTHETHTMVASNDVAADPLPIDRIQFDAAISLILREFLAARSTFSSFLPSSLSLTVFPNDSDDSSRMIPPPPPPPPPPVIPSPVVKMTGRSISVKRQRQIGAVSSNGPANKAPPAKLSKMDPPPTRSLIVSPNKSTRQTGKSREESANITSRSTFPRSRVFTSLMDPARTNPPSPRLPVTQYIPEDFQRVLKITKESLPFSNHDQVTMHNPTIMNSPPPRFRFDALSQVLIPARLINEEKPSSANESILNSRVAEHDASTHLHPIYSALPRSQSEAPLVESSSGYANGVMKENVEHLRPHEAPCFLAPPQSSSLEKDYKWSCIDLSSQPLRSKGKSAASPESNTVKVSNSINAADNTEDLGTQLLTKPIYSTQSYWPVREWMKEYGVSGSFVTIPSKSQPNSYHLVFKQGQKICLLHIDFKEKDSKGIGVYINNPEHIKYFKSLESLKREYKLIEPLSIRLPNPSSSF